jgi:predicted nuclease of predicted toxin-antitoxin system
VKFLIDECLSVELVHIARDRGFHQSTHVTWLGLRSWGDWNLMRVVLDDDFTFVTNNAIDFRRLYGTTDLHAGLVCIGTAPGMMSLDLQKRLFRLALGELGDDEPVNQVLEITADAVGVVIERYDLPN